MILSIFIFLFLLVALSIAMFIAIAPRKFLDFLSALYGMEVLRRDVSESKYRFTGVIMTVWILMMIVLWWRSN